MGDGPTPAPWPTLADEEPCPDCGPLDAARAQEHEIEQEKERGERAVAPWLGLARWGHRPEGPHPVIDGLAWPGTTNRQEKP